MFTTRAEYGVAPPDRLNGVSAATDDWLTMSRAATVHPLTALSVVALLRKLSSPLAIGT